MDDLIEQGHSGFYELPAPVYQGDVQPRSVVYLSNSRDIGLMPVNVRGLTAVRDYEASLKTATVVVIDPGILYIAPADKAEVSRPRASGRGRKARAAHGDPWHGCLPQYFCVYGAEGWGGGMYPVYGPTHVGNGWYNWSGVYNNFADSMVNHRDNGDSLLADGSNGNGTRYCARQHSEDSTFSNNPIGLAQASSYALLPSNIDRC
jgi:hypothetical protein